MTFVFYSGKVIGELMLCHNIVAEDVNRQQRGGDSEVISGVFNVTNWLQRCGVLADKPCGEIVSCSWWSSRIKETDLSPINRDII